MTRVLALLGARVCGARNIRVEGNCWNLLPALPQQGWQQGAECLWSGLLLHVTCGPHCTPTVHALTHQIHQERTHLFQYVISAF